MRLAHMLDGASGFLHLERYVNEGSRTYSRYSADSGVAPRYQPKSDTAWFHVPSFCVPREKVTVYQADPDSALSEGYLPNGHVVFRVHPETRGDIAGGEWSRLAEGKPVAVSPTSSTRTVLTLHDEGEVGPHFLKLHYPRRISRFVRRLREKSIHNSVRASKELADVRLPRFAYLPESLGFTYGEGPAAWGFIVREKTPRPYCGEERLLVPYFSLYSRDLKRPDDLPLLVQLIRALKADPLTFALNEVLVPVIDCWATVLLEKGLLLESHGQNLLLEVDRNGRPHRVVHRDLDVWFDPSIRKGRGLPLPFLGEGIGGENAPPREHYLSLIYDWFIGHHMFDYIAKVLETHCAVDSRDLHQGCREAFRRFFPDIRGWFTEGTSYYFSDEPQPENGYALVNTGVQPVWR